MCLSDWPYENARAWKQRAARAEAEVERLRALTIDDPTSIYHDHAAERALADRLAEVLEAAYRAEQYDGIETALAAWKEARCWAT